MRKKLLFGALIAAASLAGITSCASKENNTLIVGMECNYSPFNWTTDVESEYTLPIENAPGQFADGYDVQMARYLGEKLNMDVQIMKFEWDSLIPSLQSDKINCIIAGMSYDETRDLTVDFSTNYYNSQMTMIVKKDSDLATYTNIQQFNGKRIGSQIGTLTDSIIDQIVGVDHVTPYQDFGVAATAVISGSIDGMTAEYPVAVSICNSNPSLQIVNFASDGGFVCEDANALGVAVAVKEGNKILQEQINGALEGFNQEKQNEMMNAAITRSTNGTGKKLNFFQQIGFLLKQYDLVFLKGIGITLLLALVGTAVGLLIGMFLALGRNLHCLPGDNIFLKILKVIVSKLCVIYIEVFRGTPMMVQALILFFGGHSIGIEWNPLVCGLVIITLNTAAYMAEIVRAGINAVDNGQVEAARSLGMSNFKTMVHVVFPQALRNAIPTIGNELIVNIKDSSVLNVITVTELFMAGKIAATTYMTVASYTIVALIYLCLTLISSLIMKLIEKYLDRDTIKSSKDDNEENKEIELAKEAN